MKSFKLKGIKEPYPKVLSDDIVETISRGDVIKVEDWCRR